MKVYLMTAMVLFSASCAFGSVFDDARLWIRGAEDKNGDGWVKTSRASQDTKDFPNALKGGLPNDASHVWSARGPATNIHVVVGSVVTPLAQTTNTIPYLHFDQSVWKDVGGPKSVYGGLLRTDLPPVTNSHPRTVYVRFRLDSFMDPAACANLLTMGHSATSGKGAGWKLQLVPDNGGESFHFKVVNGRPANSANESGVGARELVACRESSVYRLSTNVWTDVVFSCGKDESGSWFVDVYSCAADGLFCRDSQSIGWNSTTQEQSNSYNSNYWLGSASSDYNASAAMNAFRGDIAVWAYWERRLSEEEAYSVMAAPRHDVFALGVKNGSSDEFAGTAGSNVDASSAVGFASVPSGFSAGDSFAVKFVLDEKSGLGLPQAVRMSATDVSEMATFSLVLNGDETTVQSLRVMPGDTGVVVFRANAFRYGENTLQVTRSDAGTGIFCLDSLALGGSWSIGRRDNSHAEFSYLTAAESLRYTRTADANWKHAVINLATSGSYSVNRLYAWTDPLLSSACRSRFIARLGARRDERFPRVPMSVELRVNGRLMTTFRLTESDYVGYRDFVVTFDPGVLQPGVNVFELANTTGAPVDGGAEGYVSFDCRQFLILPNPDGLLMFLH